MRAIYGFLAFVLILNLILPTAIPVIKTSAEFSIFNTKWNGCSEFAKLIAEKGGLIPVMYPLNTIKLDKTEGTLVVVGPDIDFSSLEVEEVKKFLEYGGTLFISDDFGTANTLLEKLGIDVKFSDKPLKDVFYSKKSEFPVVVRITDPKLAVGVKNITLNIPSTITAVDGEVFSSKVSIVGGKMGSYPILTEIKYGKGRIVLLSDPSILINEMMVKNRKFVENLVNYLDEPFYFDEAHHTDFNPYSISTVYIHKELDRERAFEIFVAIAALAVFVEGGILSCILNRFKWLLRRFRRKESLFKDLPEWVDVRVLERMIREMKTGSKIGGRHGRQ
ncbi:MAG: DUF4350 domain-containing protein [Archaeoglobus sp.]|nr:DUF4350 domain-containing protein [Archaeoglobus sp.]